MRSCASRITGKVVEVVCEFEGSELPGRYVSMSSRVKGRAGWSVTPHGPASSSLRSMKWQSFPGGGSMTSCSVW